eukprot:42057-Prorocentrum_minimum.AAC.4
MGGPEGGPASCAHAQSLQLEQRVVKQVDHVVRLAQHQRARLLPWLPKKALAHRLNNHFKSIK